MKGINRMRVYLRRLFMASALLAVMAVNPNVSHAQDTTGNRLAAAERYADTFDFQSMMEQTVSQLAANVPPNQRQAYMAEMAKLEWGWLRNMAITSMVQVFTTDELRALADFYGSPVGREIFSKFPAYMGALMPAMQQRLFEESKKILSQP